MARLECVYNARAQVMTRDEATRLWRPLHGGGMSVVQLSRSAPVTSDDVTDDEAYYIIGRKENDVSHLSNQSINEEKKKIEERRRKKLQGKNIMAPYYIGRP